MPAPTTMSFLGAGAVMGTSLTNALRRPRGPDDRRRRRRWLGASSGRRRARIRRGRHGSPRDIPSSGGVRAGRGGVRGRGMSISTILPILAFGPLVIITTRSASRIASSTSWVTQIAVTRVRVHTSISTSCSCQRVRLSSMPKGSSSSSSFGDSAKARAMPTRWRMPFDMSEAGLSRLSARPTRAR